MDAKRQAEVVDTLRHVALRYDTARPPDSARPDFAAAARSLRDAADALEKMRAALEGLLAHEVYTYEGGLEARITVPQDAIDAAREALGHAR